MIEQEAIEFGKLVSAIRQWGFDKGILPAKDNGEKQCLKFIAEAGEVADAICKNDQHELMDGIGDVIVTLVLLSEIRGVSLRECTKLAYGVISKRNGRTQDGVFIKDE